MLVWRSTNDLIPDQEVEKNVAHRSHRPQLAERLIARRGTLRQLVCAPRARRPPMSPLAARLSTAMLPDISSGICTPSYERARLRSGIVHIGAGAFNRSHLAVYLRVARQISAQLVPWTGCLPARIRIST